MTSQPSQTHNRTILLTGLGLALIIAVFLSPFASKNPDGLDRVSEDLQFSDKAIEDAPATKLPFYNFFEEYSLRNVPEQIATPIAGLVGTLATFGLAWGLGKLVVRDNSAGSTEETDSSNEE